jgi:hypothetical protein
MISGVRRDVDEISALLGCYVAYSGACFPTFRDGTDRFNRNVRKKYTTSRVTTPKSAGLSFYLYNLQK